MIQTKLLPETKLYGARPFLKWAGGKQRLLEQMTKYFPPDGSYHRYFEPFLGGGAVFFHLQPEESYLSDLNSELIEVYQIVRNDVDALIETLKQHYNDREYFYSVRALDPEKLTSHERAARFIFLNRTCYNGLYRVNRQGQFNVPFGRYKNPTICDEKGLRLASRVLEKTMLRIADFEAILDLAKVSDFVYFDPPYEPLSISSSFTSYTQVGFTQKDQRRLAEVFRILHERGCWVALSNSDTSFIRELYREFPIHEISARRAINSKGDGRGTIKELLVSNFQR